MFLRILWKTRGLCTNPLKIKGLAAKGIYIYICMYPNVPWMCCNLMREWFTLPNRNHPRPKHRWDKSSCDSWLHLCLWRHVWALAAAEPSPFPTSCSRPPSSPSAGRCLSILSRGWDVQKQNHDSISVIHPKSAPWEVRTPRTAGDCICLVSLPRCPATSWWQGAL